MFPMCELKGNFEMESASYDIYIYMEKKRKKKNKGERKKTKMQEHVRLQSVITSSLSLLKLKRVAGTTILFNSRASRLKNATSDFKSLPFPHFHYMREQNSWLSDHSDLWGKRNLSKIKNNHPNYYQWWLKELT